MKYILSYSIAGIPGEAKVLAEFCSNKGYVEVTLAGEWAATLGVDPGPYDKIITYQGDKTRATAEAVLDIFEEIAAAVSPGGAQDPAREEKLRYLLENLAGLN